MLTKKDVKEYQDAVAVCGEKAQIILKEIDRVFKVIGNFYLGHVDYYWFKGAAEGEVGNLDITEDSVHFEEVHGKCKGLMQDYLNPLPAEFLFMKDEEIVNILQKDKDLHEENIRKRKNKIAYDETVRKQALSKLTKEERKALKLKYS